MLRFAGMLVSHRRHAPPLDGVELELDRAVFESWVLRRASTAGVVQDDRLTTSLGNGAPRGRRRLTVMLAGRTTVFAGRTFELAAGDALLVEDLGELVTRAEPGLAFELDWTADGELAGGGVRGMNSFRLAPSTLDAIQALLRELRVVSPMECTGLVQQAKEVLRALRAEGVPVSPDALAEPRVSRSDSDVQRLLTAVDAELSSLEQGPALTTLEARLGWTRRTVARRAQLARERYGISALSGPDWRSARDFYRLLLGTMLASHQAATTGHLARMLGYGSPVALCHAFAHAGLAAPAVVGALARSG